MVDIPIAYEYDKDYRLLPISGAWGGPTGQGSIAVDLFCETRRSPETITLQIDESSPGKPPQEKGTEESRRFVRHLLVGLVMQPEVARAIGQFLLTRADELASAQGKQST